jgi:catechol 2,3-dioxygenase-like lactoylglutathione lyase family enzyme
MQHIRTVPILRSFDEGKAREFYVGFLGFSVDWEHRFAPGLPLYMQVSREGVVLHVSEHHGDATPGSHIRVQIKGLRDLYAELTARNYKNNRPGLEHPEWGGLEMTVVDPCRNLITFSEREE